MLTLERPPLAAPDEDAGRKPRWTAPCSSSVCFSSLLSILEERVVVVGAPGMGEGGGVEACVKAAITAFRR